MRLVRAAPWVTLGRVFILLILSVNTFAVAVSGQGQRHRPGHTHAPAATAVTPEQMAAADKLLRDVRTSLTQYGRCE